MSSVVVGEQDVLVVPEVYGPSILELPRGVRQVIFNQNAYLTLDSLIAAPAAAAPYQENPDLAAVMVVSDDSAAVLEHAFPGIPIQRIRLSVDPVIFHPPAEPAPRRIAYMPRRRANEASQVLRLLELRGRKAGSVAGADVTQRHEHAVRLHVPVRDPGRVALDEDGCWVALEFCAVDVPEEPDCALAVAATPSSTVARAQPTATRLAIVRRLHSRRSPKESVGAAGARRGCVSHRHVGWRNDQPSASTAAHLAALAAGRTRFVRAPFVRCAFFVRGATALAGDLALLFGRHRSKTASFLANSVHSHPPGFSQNPSCDRPAVHRDATPSRGHGGYKADASPAEKRPRLSRWIHAVYQGRSSAHAGRTDVDPYS